MKKVTRRGEWFYYIKPYPQSPKILDFIDFFKGAIVMSLGKDIDERKAYCIKFWDEY